MNGSLYVPTQYLNLPNVGGQQMGQTLNYETFLSMSPDIVLYDYTEGAGSNASISDMQSKLNPLPVVAVYDSTNASDYTPEIQFMGTLLGNPTTANELIQFYNNVYTTVNGTVASIPMDQRKTVYYAEGPQGLQTESPISMHAQIINIAGGINVTNITDSGSGGMTPVSMEQVIAWNPDVIICGDQAFYDQIYNNSNWANIKAVQDKQVYMIPDQPYGWIDRPPGVNSIIGIPWMAKVLYPDMFQSMDMKNLTQEFYSEFYHYNLNDTEVNSILSSSGLTQY
jgi:iron complex transport system substrate-binding protein